MPDSTVMTCDIVLTVYNQPELTENCLKSIVRNFRQSDHLIIVDDGSDEKTKTLLESFKHSNTGIAIDLIRLFPNRGFIKATNEGLKRSKHQCVCLLNSDTVVTAGWLDRMTAITQKEPDIGLINPMSTTFGLYPKKKEDIESLAENLKRFSGQYRETAGCVGFCMLIRREVMDKIGLLDEVYDIGYFEDSDYSRKATAAGFRCVIAKDAYVWHREHATFKAQKRDDLFRRNRDIFHSRWGRPQRILYVSRFGKEGTIDSCMQLARQGHWVWVVLPHKAKDQEKMLRAHTNIKPVFVSFCLLYLYPIFLVLIKRKKKFETVYLGNGLYQPLRGVLQFFFRGQIKEGK